jgi:predicted GNAT family acetyltransferase
VNKIVHDKERSRFEILVDNGFAYLEYFYEDGAMNLAHTFVPPPDRHQGIAFALVNYALEYAKSHNLKIIPGCSSVTLYLEQHPEYEGLVN